jgi:Leucine-rich repeat (LRR) protein
MLKCIDKLSEKKPYNIYKNDLKYFKKDIDYNLLTPHGKTIYNAYEAEDTESIDFRMKEHTQIKERDDDEYIDLTKLNLTFIPIRLSTTLKYLFISDNQLTTLGNLSNLNCLKALDCSNNKLISIDWLPKYLEELVCSGNNLTTLDTTYLPHLKILDCNNNKLSSLTYGNSLIQLECDNNKLTALHPIKSLQTLNILSCQNNLLTYLPHYPNLKVLNCCHNQITRISNLNSLEELYCDDNKINEITGLPQVHTISCIENPEITIPYLSKLAEITCTANNVNVPLSYKILSITKIDNYELVFFHIQ